MAQDLRIHDGTGMIPTLGAIALTKDEKFTQITANAIIAAITALISKVNGRISLGSAAQRAQAGNLDAVWIEHYFLTANAEEIIPHNLGRLPLGYWPVRKDKACDVYDSNAGSWDEFTFRLKCNTAASTVLLLVF